MLKTKGQMFRYRFRNETKKNVLVPFPNLSCWEQMVSIRFRICSPGPNRNDLFQWGRFGNELRRFGLIPVRCRNVCGPFVERLFLYCFVGGHKLVFFCVLYSWWWWSSRSPGTYPGPWWWTSCLSSSLSWSGTSPTTSTTLRWPPEPTSPSFLS